jgi:carbon monoxide dehydrogenase subunit G
MKITNEFDVGVPLAQTWTTMLDVPRVARALPGAKIDPDSDGGVYRGTMKVKLGPVTTAYAGTARVEDADDDDHVASFRVEGREERGGGGAAATITLRLAEREGGTHVVVVTDMQVTGRQAQLGGRLMEEVAATILADFARRLEGELKGEGASAGSASGAGVAGFDDADEALDVSSAVRGPLLRRAAMVGGGALAGLLVGLLVGVVVRRRLRGGGAPAAAWVPPAGWAPGWTSPAGWPPVASAWNPPPAVAPGAGNA